MSKPEPSGYTDAERRWMKEYDTLVRQKKDKDRRRVLRRAMTTQRKKIWKAAQQSGWDKANRRARYKSLLARTT
jgi:7-cyano-7-deazaguanine synthase in queuosine biosynthesis